MEKNMNTSTQILELILKTIDEKKILKQDCINACGLSSTFFSDWKAGRFKSPSYEKIIKIAVYLDIDLYYLFLGDTGYNSYFLNEHESFLINYYRKLSDFDKGALIGELRQKESLSSEAMQSEKKVQ